MLFRSFFVDSVDDSKVRKATSGFTGTRVSTKAPARSRRVAAQSLDGNAPVYNDIPALASGAVIPPNRKFLAVLGDQKSGTNVEAPLSTIKQAVIIGHTQFEKIPLSAERQVAIIERQIEEITLAIQDAKADKGERYTIKQMEKTKKTLQTRLEKLNDTDRKSTRLNSSHAT